jgi:hypothetical protein
VDQKIRDTDYAKATGRERRWDNHHLYRKSTSIETQRSSERATMSHRPRSNAVRRRRTWLIATTRG